MPVISNAIDARIQRDGPGAHLKHVLALLPTNNPVRIEYGHAWRHSRREGAIRYWGGFSRPSYAGNHHLNASDEVVREAKRVNPEFEELCQ